MKNHSKPNVQILISSLGLLLFLAPMLLVGQDLSAVQSTVSQQVSPVKGIIKTIVDLVFAIGAVGVIGAFVAKREDAKQWLIYYVVAIIVWAVIRALFFTGS